MKIHFISINSITNIPSVRFIVDFFSDTFNADITIIERAIKNENNYYSQKKNVTFDNIDENDNYNNFIKQKTTHKIKKYHKLNKKIKKTLKSNEHTFIITPDFQVLNLIFIHKKLIKKQKHRIIYLQFEMIEYPGKLNAFFEKNVYKNANIIDLAIFPEKNRADIFLKKCRQKPKKQFIIPNSCRPANLSNLKPHKLLSDIPTNAFIIGHVGNVGGIAHFFDNLIKVAESLKKENIYFIFIGNQSEEVKRTKKSIKSNKILFFDKIPHQELKYIYARLNLGLILYKGISPNFEFAAPNKLYEYWAFGIPVLAHKLKGLIPIFKIPEQGKLIDMNNIEEIKNSILNAQKTDKNKLIKYFNDNLKIDNYFNNLEKNINELKK